MLKTPEQFWELTLAVTQILSEADNVRDPLRRVLLLIAQRINADAAGLWRVDYENVVMRCAEFYSPDPASTRDFEVVTRSRAFAFNEGLPGAAWASRRPELMLELLDGKQFPRRSVAEAAGLSSAVAFPVLSGERVLGVFEFFFRRRIESNPKLLEVFAAIGKQVGLYVQKLRVEEELTGLEAQAQMLSMRALDAIITINEESTILFVNAAAEEMFGYAASELQGKSLTMLIPPELRERHLQGLKAYLGTGHRNISWEGAALPALHKSGELIPVVISFGEFRRGERRLFSGYIRRATAAGTLR